MLLGEIQNPVDFKDELALIKDVVIKNLKKKIFE